LIALSRLQNHARAIKRGRFAVCGAAAVANSRYFPDQPANFPILYHTEQAFCRVF